MLEIADRHAIVTDTWFAGTGLSRAQLATPDTKVSFRQAATVLRRALRALPPGPIGIRAGSRDVQLSFGMLGFAIRCCRTGAEALAIGLELHQAAGSLMDFESERFGAEFAIRMTERAPEPELLPFLCEDACCSTSVLIRAVLGADIAATRLEFTYPAPAYAADYRRAFRCPVQFGADANRIYFPADLLTRRIPTHNPTELPTALAAARRLLGLADVRSDIVATVESLLRTNLRRPMTMVDVAARLNITERTLRRRLADAGQQFGAVRDQVRHERAALLLRESGQSIAEIAAAVGFSDAREFRRAYLRWTGRPPSADR